MNIGRKSKADQIHCRATLAQHEGRHHDLKKRGRGKLAKPIITVIVSLLGLQFVQFTEYPTTTDAITNRKHTNTTKVVIMPKTRKCQQTYFWGGGKAGSTSLYNLLTHFNSIDNIGGFNGGYGIGKEPCLDSNERWDWLALTEKSICRDVDVNTHSSVEKTLPTHILNGCPRHTTQEQAVNILNIAKAETRQTFLMLIRDPIDRLVSHLNDDVRRGGKKFNVNERARFLAHASPNDLHNKLSYQGLALMNLLKVVDDPSSILIIPMESMTVNPQGVVDAVMDHVGGDRWRYNARENTKMNKGNNDGYQYVHLKNETRDALRDVFREDVQLLEFLVGRQFSWSSWAAKGENNNPSSNGSSDWLVTTPKVVKSKTIKH